MITNPIYINQITQIANLFCESSPTPDVCKANLVQRIVTSLSNSEWSYVLAHLNEGRFYLTSIKSMQTQNNLCWYIKTRVDLITGAVDDYGFSTQSVGCQRCPTISCLKSKYAQKGWLIISGNKDFTSQNYKDLRLEHVPADANYGLTYTPGSVGGGSQPVVPTGGGNGGGQIQPEPTPGGMVPTSETGFDFGELFKNPLVLIALAFGAYVLLKD